MNIDLGIVRGFVRVEIAPKKDSAHDQHEHNRDDDDISCALRASISRRWRKSGRFLACVARQSWWVFVSHGSMSFEGFRIALLAAAADSS
jgi:hypothetical protein